MNIKSFVKIIPAVAFALVAFVFSGSHVKAASCVPGTGMATLTNNAVTAPAAGSYKVWIRVSAASALAVKSRVEVTPLGGAATCFEVTNPAPTTTGWQWVNAGTTTLTTTGNTVKVVGVDAGVRVDRLIMVAATSTCTPSNTRVTTTSPITEPGDNCIVAAPTTTVTTTVTPPPTSTVTPPPADTTAPVGPASLNATSAGATQINLSWPAATDNVGVTSYILTRNGVQISAGTNLSYSDTGLTAGTTYQYKVVARDAAGNVSTGASASVATQSATVTNPASKTK